MQSHHVHLRCAVALALGLIWLPFLLGPLAAHAAPTCRALDEPGLRGLVSDGVDAVQRGDPEAQRVLTGEITERVPCLTFAPSPRLWADVLVLIAISRYLDDEPWQPALGAALRLRPRVQRHVGRAHPIYRFEAPLQDDRILPLLPAGVEAYIDGERATRQPPADVVHLVQVRQGERWRSALLAPGEALEEAFLTTPIREKYVTRYWGHLGLGTSMTVLHQRVPIDGRDGSVLRYPSVDRPWINADLIGRATARRGPFGVTMAVDLSVFAFERLVGNDAHVAVLYGRGRSQIGGGLGIFGMPVVDNEGVRVLGASYGLLVLKHAGPIDDGSVELSAGRGVAQVGLSLGRIPPFLAEGPLPVRYGISGRARYARTQLGEPSSALQGGNLSYRVVLELGVGAPAP